MAIDFPNNPVANDTFTAGNISYTFDGSKWVNQSISIVVPPNSIGADELDVADNGSAGQALLSDGDGSFSWGAAGADLTDDTSTDSDFYPTLSDSTTGSFTTATVSSSKLKFNPSSGTLEATDFNSLSDKRVKTDIKPLTDSIEKISSLRGVSFRFKDSDKESIGVIAQEIESVLPEVVYTGSNGLKSVSYGNIVGLLIEAIKEHQAEIDNLKSKLGE